MKKIFLISSILIAFAMVGCDDNFMEKKDLYTVDDIAYYKTPEDIAEALTAAYACLPSDAGVNDEILVANLLSDECFGGGGTNDDGFHDIDLYTNTNEDLYLELWGNSYRGIFRCNMILKRFDQTKYSDMNERNQALGEAYFLRAYFNLRLAHFFGTFPLITVPEPLNLPKSTPDEIFAQIISDLKNAIYVMPATKITAIPTSRLGHATKWAAEALMARAFLYYTGVYEKNDVTLPDGSTVTKSQVTAWVDDCIANSGHKLVPDFRNIWPYSYATDGYKYAADNNLNWVGEEGGNLETIFAIKYGPYGGWNRDGGEELSYTNQLTLYMAMRGQDGIQPFATGWGGGPVNPQLWNSFEDGDIRKAGSICDVTDPNEGEVSTKYVWGVWEAVDETGLWQKKYTPIQVKNDKGALVGMYCILVPGTIFNYQLWNLQDEILIRYADVLLMGAELGSANAQSYLDQVRSRAGLASVPVTLENIKKERLHELAFEGLRHFDLQRWHDMESAHAAVKNIPVKVANVDAVYNDSYRPETNGYLPIPESQVKLSGLDGEGKPLLRQNTGWEK